MIPFRNVSLPKDEHNHRCPCCGYRTLSERGGYEICSVCFWEDDGQDDHDAEEVRGGPNGRLSLAVARDRAGYIAVGWHEDRIHGRSDAGIRRVAGFQALRIGAPAHLSEERGRSRPPENNARDVT
jgi:hypothetical protein